MEYTTFGRTGLEISRIGFGCWATGGYGWGPVRDEDSISAIRHALDLGVTFFDTADVYGLGHAEEVLAEALGADFHKVVVATKFGVAWNEEGETSRDISSKRVRVALEGSLRRLKTDCIPLYQIHWPDGKTEIEDTMAELEKCRTEGKVMHVGCSNFPADMIERANVCGRLESTQFPYSVISRSAEGSEVPACMQWEMTSLAYGVLEKGLLSGKYSAETMPVFADSDVRSRDENFCGDKFLQNIIIAQKLAHLGESYDKTAAQTALRWVLDSGNVSCAIVGMKSVSQVDANCGALGWSLEADDAMDIASWC